MRKKLSRWLDPETHAAREESRAIILNASEAMVDLRRQIERQSQTIDQLGGKLADAGVMISARNQQVQRLRSALFVARPYVQDAVEEANTMVGNTKSKDRKAAALAVLGAVEADLAAVNDAIKFAGQA